MRKSKCGSPDSLQHPQDRSLNHPSVGTASQRPRSLSLRTQLGGKILGRKRKRRGKENNLLFFFKYQRQRPTSATSRNKIFKGRNKPRQLNYISGSYTCNYNAQNTGSIHRLPLLPRGQLNRGHYFFTKKRSFLYAL